jgi:hypothetical protein
MQSWFGLVDTNVKIIDLCIFYTFQEFFHKKSPPGGRDAIKEDTKLVWRGFHLDNIHGFYKGRTHEGNDHGQVFPMQGDSSYQSGSRYEET